LIFLVSLPATLALLILAEPLLVTLFQNDNFTAVDVTQAAGSLRAYSVGILAFMSIKIFAPGYYARQNTRTPVKIGVIALCTNMVLNIVFYLNGMAHVGLALATSLAAFLNAALLFRGLKKEQVFAFQAGWLLLLLRLLAANVVLAFFLVSFTGNWQDWLDWGLMSRVSQMALLVFGGMALYVAVLFASGLKLRHINR
jgi:putative peptidoglycan lipid II flippase